MGEHIKQYGVGGPRPYLCMSYIWCFWVTTRSEIEMGNKETEGSYIFVKLKGTENYKEWAREMGFALQDADLETYADGTGKKPKLYIESKITLAAPAMPLSEQKIEKRQAEVEKWVPNNSRTCGKIGKMCSRSVQQQLKKTWTAKEMWDSL